MILAETDVRVCNNCKQEKPLGDYHKVVLPNGRLRIRHTCKLCANQKSNQKYYANREKRLAQGKVYTQTEKGQLVSKRARLKHNYGISLEAYQKMVEDQKGVCALCGATEAGGRWNRDFFVDHNHKTGEVRALLCHNCNAGIGHFFENQELLLKAIDYLKKHQK